MGYQTWFGWLVEWVKDVVFKFRKPAERKLLTLELLESRCGKAKAELVRRNTPGSVATWFIYHASHPKSQVIITLDNIAEIKRFLHEALPLNTNNPQTHIVSIQWLIRVGAKEKKVYKFKAAYLADLQGGSTSINAKAHDVVRYLVLEIINLPTLPGMSWELRLDKYSWQEAITSKCRLISESHNPQLKKIPPLKLIAKP
jgi:hypothetical protein